MPAGVYNFTIEQGETFVRVLTWQDEELALVNLTGYTARMQLRANRSDTAAVSLTTDNGGIVLGGAAGTITITITAAQTAALVSSVYFYDLELVSGTGIVTKLIKGTATLAREVTA